MTKPIRLEEARAHRRRRAEARASVERLLANEVAPIAPTDGAARSLSSILYCRQSQNEPSDFGAITPAEARARRRSSTASTEKS
jgi:hypothetical protein